MTVREQRCSILHAAVEQLLDHLDDDEDYSDEAALGVVAVVCEIEWTDDDGDQRTGIAFWCSDPRRFVQHGLLAMAARQAIE
jgi:hypothetical protein